MGKNWRADPVSRDRHTPRRFAACGSQRTVPQGCGGEHPTRCRRNCNCSPTPLTTTPISQTDYSPLDNFQASDPTGSEAFFSCRARLCERAGCGELGHANCTSPKADAKWRQRPLIRQSARGFLHPLGRRKRTCSPHARLAGQLLSLLPLNRGKQRHMAITNSIDRRLAADQHRHVKAPGEPVSALASAPMPPLRCRRHRSRPAVRSASPRGRLRQARVAQQHA